MEVDVLPKERGEGKGRDSCESETLRVSWWWNYEGG